MPSGVHHSKTTGKDYVEVSPGQWEEAPSVGTHTQAETDERLAGNLKQHRPSWQNVLVGAGGPIPEYLAALIAPGMENGAQGLKALAGGGVTLPQYISTMIGSGKAGEALDGIQARNQHETVADPGSAQAGDFINGMVNGEIGGRIAGPVLGGLGKWLLKRGGASAVAKYGPKIGQIVDEATASGAKIPWDPIKGELEAVRGPLAAHATPQGRGIASQLEQAIGNVQERAVPMGHVMPPDGLGPPAAELGMTPRAVHDAKGELAEFAGFHKMRQTPGQERLGRMAGVMKGAEERAVQAGAPKRFPEFMDAKEIYGPAQEAASRAQAASEVGLIGPTGAVRLMPTAGALAGGAVGGPMGAVKGAAAMHLGRKFIPAAAAKGAFLAGEGLRGAARSAPVSGPALGGLIEWLMNRPDSAPVEEK